VLKTVRFGALLEVEKMLRCGFAWQAQGIRFCSSFKSVGKRGAFEEDLQRFFCVAGGVQETDESDMLGLLGGLGPDLLRGLHFRASDLQVC